MNLSIISHVRYRTTILLVVMALALSLLPIAGIITRAAGNSTSSHPFGNFKGLHYALAQQSTRPPTDQQCLATIGFPCYSPQEIRRAYGVTPLLDAGYTGKGQTIVIIDSFGSPTIRHDLHVFDQGFGLPDPPSFQILSPLGTVPYNPKKIPDQVGWAFETSLDVEWAHAMAPGANIVLMTSPVDETQGVMGMPQFLFLEQYALDHHLGKIISQSWATTENTLFDGGEFVLDQFESFYARADQEHVTIFASSGDSGTANPNVNGKIYPFPTVGFPASSPLITAVGGTSLYADPNGNYDHETIWNESARSGGATGGGISKFFGEPDYQQNYLPKSDQQLLNNHRGLPDIAYNADPFTGILIYISFPAPSLPPGYYIIGGTSEGSPQWAGIIADANQLAGRPLGFLNPALYELGSGDYAENFHDIIGGNNSYAGIPGYKATPGWDPTTGWGTPKVATLVKELIEVTAQHSI